MSETRRKNDFDILHELQDIKVASVKLENGFPTEPLSPEAHYISDRIRSLSHCVYRLCDAVERNERARRTVSISTHEFLRRRSR